MNPPIRVLLHVDSLAIGGLEKKVMQIALRLDRERFEPLVSYSKEWGACGEELQRRNVRVERLTPCAPESPGASEAVHQIRRLAPDLFHSFSCRQSADDVWTARKAGVPVILTARGNMRHWTPPGPARNWEFDRNRLTHYVTACCDAVAQMARSVEGIHPDRLAVILNGVEIPHGSGGPALREELGIPAGMLLAGYAAKYRPLKAHEMLLRVWQKVTAVRPDAFLVCCGEDEENRRQRLQELADQLGLANNVMLLGVRQEMPSFYRGLDLYVHASRSEGLSNAILEAMSHGLPVVAMAVGGTAEAIEDGVSGVVTPPEPRALTEAILRICEDPEKRRKLGQAARQRIEEKFSVSQMIGGYESLYERAVSNAPPPDRRPLSGLAFTGSAESPRLDDTTVFVITVGDTLNFEDCMKHLEVQTVRCRVELIDRVAPISAAFQEMHARCATPYYVQVDEDMMLYPHTLSKLHELMTESEPGVPMVCAPLWDCDVERPILGIKIYRHDIVKRFPYPNTLRFEVDQLRKMADAGHHALVLSTEEADAVCLGEHGEHYRPETIFRRWQHLFHRRNEAGHLMWLDPWPGRLLERYVKTRDQVHLFAALGAIAGIAGRAEGGGDVDWRDINPALQRLQYYFSSADGPRDAGTEGAGKA